MDVRVRQGTDTEFPSNRVAGGVYGIQFSRCKAITVQNECSQYKFTTCVKTALQMEFVGYRLGKVCKQTEEEM